MFTSRSFPHQLRVECGGTPEAYGAREIIGDAILRFRNRQNSRLIGSSHSTMTIHTIPHLSATSLSGTRHGVARRGVPSGTRGRVVCGFRSRFAPGLNLGAKSNDLDARGYRGIPAFAMGIDAASGIELGDRFASGRIGAGPDAGRRTP